MRLLGPSPAATGNAGDVAGTPDRDDIRAVRAALADLRTFVDRGGYGAGARSGRPGATRRRVALLDELIDLLDGRVDLIELIERPGPPPAGGGAG